MNVKVVPSMMADNVHRKSHKLSDVNRKLINPINRTTTETIRLGEPGGGGGVGVGVGVGVGSVGTGVGLIDCKKLELDRRETIIDGRTHPGVGLGLGLGLSVPSNINIPNNQCRKKTSSFQITSVTVGNRMSNDAGDDSNDDLDESHGEDNSVELSRITDIETPSYSEDTFSKEDVFFNTSNAALSTAPVIPTSSQYGLAIVPSSEGGNVNNSTNDNNINTLDITSVTDNNIINLLSSNVKQDNDIRDVHSHSRNERFKVVKIESTEPFKRGRWTCMDYLDHTSVNNQSNNTTVKVSDPNEICISYGVNDAGGVVSFDPSKQQQQHQQSNIVDDKSSAPPPVINPLDMNGHATHQDILGSVAMTSNNGVYQVNSIPQNVPTNVPRNSPSVQQSQPPTQIPQYFQSSPQQQQQQPQAQQQQQQQQNQPPQGATLPANLQNTHPSNLGQPQSMPQGSISIITQPNNNNVTPQQNITHSKDDNTTYVTVNSQNQSIPPSNVCQSSTTTSSQPSNILVTQHQNQQPSPQQQTTQQQQQQPMTQITEPINAITNLGIQNIQQVPQSGSPQSVHQVLSSNQQLQGTAPPQNTGASPQVQINQVAGQNVVGGIPQQQQQQQQPPPNMGFPHQPDAEQESLSGMGNTAAGSQLADAALLECLAEVTQANDDHHTLEDNESMSGTSAVAIDNKIEQAMDLVKSHLMFAVREEVEVLKEKIAELMDRINLLEAENLILKAHATPETLAQLGQATTKLSQNNSGSGQ